MYERKDTIAFISNYICELEKHSLDEKGLEMLTTMRNILRKQIELEDTLSLLKGKRKSIESKRPMLFSHIIKHQYDREPIIEELSNDRKLNRTLDMAVALIMRDGRR